uniref:YceI family protein n=1 Tax=Caldilinea aerophila TaxID=133453 RepID=A0A7C1FJV0_9CHLR
MSSRFVKWLMVLIIGVSMAGCAQPLAPVVTPQAPQPAASPEATVETEEPAEAEAAETGRTVSGLRTFVIVPEESRASYLVDEEFFGGALAKLGIPAGFNKVIGSTQAIEGRLQLNLDDLSAPLGENIFTVRINTLKTDRDDRDQWIRENGPRLDSFPIATFVAKSIEGAPSSYQEGEEVSFKLSGDLTIRNITRPVTFDVTASLNGDTLKGVATTRLLMSDFGIEQLSFVNTLTVADEFGLEIHITAREEQ